jgi:hypothetical protein
MLQDVLYLQWLEHLIHDGRDIKQKLQPENNVYQFHKKLNFDRTVNFLLPNLRFVQIFYNVHNIQTRVSEIIV